MKIDLHLVSWNRPAMTKLVIQVIARNTARESYRLLVWDNGSEPDTQAMLSELLQAGLIDELILHDTNIGLEAARQELLSLTQGEYFVCVDNDCLPPPRQEGEDWLARLFDLMDEHQTYAAIALRTQIMIGTGNIFEEADLDGTELVDFPHPGGSYRMMLTDVVDAVDGWQHKTPGRGAEERYICGKLRQAGFGTAFAAKLTSLHLFGLPDTDNWGYPKDWRPEDTGHSPDVWHPIFAAGDDYSAVEYYVGKELAQEYFT